MENKKLRVVVIGTGNIASKAIRAMDGRHDIELVGVWAHKETAGHLIGTDSGLLDWDKPNGIIITGDEEEIFALKPDCAIIAINIRDVILATTINGEWYKKFLSRGINVISPSVPDLIWPKAAQNKQVVEEVEKAALEGNATLHINGQEPGYAENQAFLLATCSNTIKRITISEMYNYSTVPVREEMSFAYGFDELPEYKCMLENPLAQLTVWGLTVQHIANHFGFEVEKMTTSFEKRTVDYDVPVAWGTIEAGKTVAVRLRTCGYVNGREAVVLEHVNRMAQDVAMDWPYTTRVGQISVNIEGDPNLQVDMNVGTPDRPLELAYEGSVLTAMRLVNAVVPVCEAKPGIATIHDIPMGKPSNVFRSDAVAINHK